MKKLSILAVATVLSVAPALAAAALVYEDLDTNADGYLSRSEVASDPTLYEEFDRVDSNGDGKINIDEFVAEEGRGRFVPPEENEVSEIGAAPTK